MMANALLVIPNLIFEVSATIGSKKYFEIKLRDFVNFYSLFRTYFVGFDSMLLKSDGKISESLDEDSESLESE